MVAEDDANDVFMMERAVRLMKASVVVHFVKDGQEAIDYLSRQHKFSDLSLFPLPTLILLDIKMPRKTGFDVLEWLKQEGGFEDIPVIMLTSSRMPDDVTRALDLGARAYLVKPLDSNKLRELFTNTENFLTAQTV